MNNYATDTMALVLRLEHRKQPQKVKSLFEQMELGHFTIHIPAIVLAEIGYLSEKQRIETNLQHVKSYCNEFPSIQIEVLSEAIIEKSFEIDDIPELHDRLIAGTAFFKNFTLITNDPKIEASKYISTIWN